MRLMLVALMAATVTPGTAAAETRLFILLSATSLACPASECQGRLIDLDIDSGVVLGDTLVPYARPAGGDLGITPDGRYLLWSGANALGHANVAALFDTSTRVTSFVTIVQQFQRLLVDPELPRAYLDDTSSILVGEPGGVNAFPDTCPAQSLADMSRDGARLLVSCGAFRVLDSGSGAIVADIPEPAAAGFIGHGALFNVTGTEIYRAASAHPSDPPNLQLIRQSVASGAVLDRYAEADRNGLFPLTIDQRTDRLFAFRPGVLRVFTTSPLGALTTIAGPAPDAIPKVVLDPDAPRMFVVWYAASGVPQPRWRSWLQVINTETFAVTSIGELAANAHAVAIAIGPKPASPTGLAATVAGRRVVLRWTAGVGKPVTAYTIEAGSGPGLSDLAQIRVFDTTLAVDNVPPGTYHVRVRPVNALGAGAASNELLVSVP